MYATNNCEVAVALVQIDVDEDALTEAMRLSGAKTKKETVKLALREYAARHRRVAGPGAICAASGGMGLRGRGAAPGG